MSAITIRLARNAESKITVPFKSPLNGEDFKMSSPGEKPNIKRKSNTPKK
jgi:hypothetical protein